MNRLSRAESTLLNCTEGVSEEGILEGNCALAEIKSEQLSTQPHP
jgi:hypothetical protein